MCADFINKVVLFLLLCTTGAPIIAIVEISPYFYSACIDTKVGTRLGTEKQTSVLFLKKQKINIAVFFLCGACEMCNFCTYNNLYF
jgi:hypothetical protein